MSENKFYLCIVITIAIAIVIGTSINSYYEAQTAKAAIEAGLTQDMFGKWVKQ